METYTHKDYSEYMMAQRTMTRIRTNHGADIMSSITRDLVCEVNGLIHQHIDKIKRMVCHGCRSGVEVVVFQELNPESIIFGTDIYGKAYKFDRKNFKEMDFDRVPENWIGYFDVVYSNSIDHSRNPINTLKAWKSELRDGGIFFITFWCGLGVSKSNCFRLNNETWSDEVRNLAEKVEMKVLYISSKYLLNYSRTSHFCVDTIWKK